MFVVLGATGNTGSVVVRTLLSAGKKVRAVVRDAAKASALSAAGAEIHVADISDPAALGRAVEGAEGAYFLLPPDMAARDFVAERKKLTEVQIAALAAARVPHVVLLSSVGAEHEAGTGPIRTVHNAEQQLRAAGIPSTFVRAGYFVENWGAVVQAAQKDGVLPSFIALDKRLRMVSTEDIGKTAAAALLDGPPHGPRGVRVIELGGPTDPTAHEVAAAFAQVLGRPVQAILAPLEAVVPTFTSFGISENVASLYREMYEGIERGLLVPASSEQVRGTTTLAETVRKLVG